jgi:hypothetical protein
MRRTFLTLDFLETYFAGCKIQPFEVGLENG